MKINSIFKFVVFSTFGIFLRIIFYYSQYKDYLKSLLIFDQAPYNFDNIKENYIYALFHKESVKRTNISGFFNDTNQNMYDLNYYSEYDFISKPIALLYKYIKSYPKEYIFIFFIICDLLIAYLISTFKYHCILSFKDNDIEGQQIQQQKQENKEETDDTFNSGVFCFYLCNPISITSCISFNLDIVFTLINLLLSYYSNNLLLCPIFTFVSIIISPGYIFITIIFFVFLLVQDFKKYKNNIIISIILLIIYFRFGQNYLDYFPFESLKNIYYNYYMFKDLRPNLGMLWVLLPSTFLKYQNYTLMMYLIYQIALSLSVMLNVNRIQNKDYKYKNSLVYILIFYITHILDRYPSENHLVVILCLLLQHYEIIKVKIFDLGIYCAFASYTLIVCRGFPYTHGRSGSSNYLFYQNLTYAVSHIMIIMFSLTGINDYRNNCKKKDTKEEEKKDNEIKEEEQQQNEIKEEEQQQNENEVQEIRLVEDNEENEENDIVEVIKKEKID